MGIFHPIFSKETVRHSTKPALLIRRYVGTLAGGAVLRFRVEFYLQDQGEARGHKSFYWAGKEHCQILEAK